MALLYPTSSSTHALTAVGTFGDIAAELRRLVDYDLCDERMVQEGALEGKQILIVTGADILESRTLAKIQTWVSDGGLLLSWIAGLRTGMANLRSWTAWRDSLPGQKKSTAFLS